MPRIQISINGLGFHIDSSDRDTIRAWLAEILRFMPGHQADYCTVQVYPLWHPVTPGDPRPVPDWPVTDSRWLGRMYEVSANGIDEMAVDLREALEGPK